MPTPAFPWQVVTDQTIESAWGNSVATWANRMLQEATIMPVVTTGGNLDAGNATQTDWIVTTVSIPTWARYAYIQTTVAGFYEASGTANLPFTMRLRLGAQAGGGAPQDGQGIGRRITSSWGDIMTMSLSGTGSQQLAVQAQRVSGGVMRFDTACRCVHRITFIP